MDTSKPANSALPARYWRRLRALTLLLLAVWAAVTFFVPWFARDLNRWQFAGMPMGLWLSSQGAIAVYLLLIVAYALCSDRLERDLEPMPVSGGEPGRHD